MQNRYFCYEKIVHKPAQAAVCAGFFNNFESFQQPRAAFWLAVRMDLFLSLKVFLSLDLYLGWCWFRFGLSLVLWLCLYMACKPMHLHSQHRTATRRPPQSGGETAGHRSPHCILISFHRCVVRADVLDATLRAGENLMPIPGAENSIPASAPSLSLPPARSRAAPDDACTRGHVVTFLYRACA